MVVRGHLYALGRSAASVGAEAIHMQMLTIPPGESGRAHKYNDYETAIYILSGENCVWCREHLEFDETARAGEYVCIPVSLPHMRYNPSATAKYVAIIARTNPNEQESVILLPDLDATHAAVTHHKTAATPDGRSNDARS